MPPSDRAMRRFGWRFQNEPCSQSAALLEIDIGMVVIQASIGVSSEACAARAPVPMWQLRTTRWSASAFQTGSQQVLWRLGRPTRDGLSGKATAWTPSAAIRSTSCTVAGMSQRGSSAIGMKRPGAAPHQSWTCQSL